MWFGFCLSCAGGGGWPVDGAGPVARRDDTAFMRGAPFRYVDLFRFGLVYVWVGGFWLVWFWFWYVLALGLVGIVEFGWISVFALVQVSVRVC